MQFTTSLIAAVAALATTSAAWNIEMWKTQNSCGGAGAPDSSTGGPGGQTTECRELTLFPVSAMNLTDWEDGCEIDLFAKYDCSQENLKKTFRKDEEDVQPGNWVCVNEIANAYGTIEAVSYRC